VFINRNDRYDRLRVDRDHRVSDNRLTAGNCGGQNVPKVIDFSPHLVREAHGLVDYGKKHENAHLLSSTWSDLFRYEPMRFIADVLNLDVVQRFPGWIQERADFRLVWHAQVERRCIRVLG